MKLCKLWEIAPSHICITQSLSYWTLAFNSPTRFFSKICFKIRNFLSKSSLSNSWLLVLIIFQIDWCITVLLWRTDLVTSINFYRLAFQRVIFEIIGAKKQKKRGWKLFYCFFYKCFSLTHNFLKWGSVIWVLTNCSKIRGRRLKRGRVATDAIFFWSNRRPLFKNSWIVFNGFPLLFHWLAW